MALDPKSRLARFIRLVMRDVTYHKHYVCTVESQNGMTLDLKPDDERIAGAGLGAVPLRVGLPGFTVEVPQGARVLLSFDNGDPSKPAAALFDPGSVTRIVFDGGTQAVARQGDLVESGGVGTVVIFDLPVPTGIPSPLTTLTPYLVSFGPMPPTAAFALPLYGSIATGRAEFQS